MASYPSYSNYRRQQQPYQQVDPNDPYATGAGAAAGQYQPYVQPQPQAPPGPPQFTNPIAGGPVSGERTDYIGTDADKMAQSDRNRAIGREGQAWDTSTGRMQGTQGQENYYAGQAAGHPDDKKKLSMAHCRFTMTHDPARQVTLILHLCARNGCLLTSENDCCARHRQP